MYSVDELIILMYPDNYQYEGSNKKFHVRAQSISNDFVGQP
jgi:hypothetical protein